MCLVRIKIDLVWSRWGVNRWLSVRFNLTSSVAVGITGVVVLLTPSIDASLAGFALAFVSMMMNDVCNPGFLTCLDMKPSLSYCSWLDGSLGWNRAW
jgi:hypothetical protein